MFCNWLSGGFGSRKRKKPIVRPSFRPRLEELEERATPAGTYTWVGGDPVSPSAWTDTKNWNIVGGNHAYPGAMNSNDDNVVFNNTATTNAVLPQSIALNSLYLATNFTQAMQVTGGSCVSVVNGTNSSFNMQGGTLTFKNASSMQLSGLGTNATWTGGDLSSTGDPGASIYIFNSTTFLINTDATKLGASLIVGESQSGANSPGVVNLADPTFQSGMSGNLTLYQNAGMTIMPTGTLNLNQSFFSNTKGGIAQAAGSTGAINNQGTTNRLGTDAVNALQIGVPIMNSAATSVFYTGPNTLTDCSAAGFYLNAGQLQRTRGSSFKGCKGKIGGGVIRVVDAGGPGRFNVYFADSVEVGSYLVFNDSVGDYCNLVVNGNLTIDPGAQLMVNVNGSANGSGDQIQVAGTTTINSAALMVTAQYTYPPYGNTYAFLASSGGFASGTGWTGVTGMGYYTSWSFSGLGQVTAT